MIVTAEEENQLNQCLSIFVDSPLSGRPYFASLLFCIRHFVQWWCLVLLSGSPRSYPSAPVSFDEGAFDVYCVL